MTIKMALPLVLIAFLTSAYGVPKDAYTTEKGVICYTCPPGKFFVRDCSLDYDSAVCSPCPNGHYIGFNNLANKCQPCSTVCSNTNYESVDDQPEMITANCTSISDIVCECKLGFWRESGYRGMCRRAKKCIEGYGVTVQANGKSDTACEACEPGQTFSNTTSATDACLPCSKCYAHMYVRNECKTDRDTECILTTTTELTSQGDDSRELYLGLGLGIGIPLPVACAIILLFCFVRRNLNEKKQNPVHDNNPILKSDVTELKKHDASKLSSSDGTHGNISALQPSSSVYSIHISNEPRAALNGRIATTDLPYPYVIHGQRISISIWSGIQPRCVDETNSSSRETETPSHGKFKKDYDDTLTQPMMDIYAQAMKSVGAIVRFDQAFGTGFRVGSLYVLTALHVVTNIIDPRQCGEQDHLKLSEASIVFNYSLQDSSKRYHFDTQLYFSDEDLDICILKIIDGDGHMPGKLTLRKEPLAGVNVDTVSLIGYGHQRNPNKHFDHRCPIVCGESPAIHEALAFFNQNAELFKKGVMVQNPSSVVGHGYQGYDAPHTMLVHCYMEKGASGAPMLACVDPSAGIVEVVGVLTHGIPLCYFCLDEQTKRIFPNKHRFEVGTRVSSIYERMVNQQNSRTNGLVENLFI